MTLALTCIAAVLADLWLGRPRGGRRLARFGRLAARVRAALDLPSAELAGGTAGFLLLVLPFAALANLLGRLGGPPVSLLVLALGLGATSLTLQVRSIEALLATGEFGRAAEELRRLSGRAPSNPAQLAAFGVGELLRLAAEGVFAVLFWFVLAGPGGVVALRLSQALGREWGGSRAFGATSRLAVRVLHFVPERLAALTYLLLGDRRGGWRAWRGGHGSGLPETVGAAALGLGAAPGPADLGRAVRLVRVGLWGWLLLLLLAGLFA